MTRLKRRCDVKNAKIILKGNKTDEIINDGIFFPI